MNNETLELLEQHFDTAFAAPNGIKKLRELILTLAMQGKLVPQDPKDQPASELLKEIEAEKLRLVKAGKIKQPKPLPDIKPEEVPYELPQGWEWVRMGEITDYNGRKNISPEEVAPDTWLLDLEDIEKDTSRIIYRAKYSERQSKSTKSIFYKGDVLYGKLRPYLNKVVVADSEGVCTTEIVPVVPLGGIDSQFLKWLLKRPSFLSHVSSLMYGVKMPRLGTDDANKSVHPLPPVTEQRRIVAKIDQLMSRCDELEKLRNEREQKRLAVHTAALSHLLDAASLSSSPTLSSFPPSSPSFPRRRESSTIDCLGPRLRGSDGVVSGGDEVVNGGVGTANERDDAFTHAWQFLTQHFRELYSVKENVTELRKAILQLAVMGKLVPQDPNDHPASELLKEIEAEKQRLVKEGKIKAQKPLPAIKPQEVPYELPRGWEWVRVWDVAQLITSGSRDWAKYYSENGAIFVTMSNLSRGSYNLRMDTIRYVLPPVDGEGSRTKLEESDLLISITGDVGNLGLVPANFGEAYINQHTCLLRFMPNCRSRYFPELMRSPLAKEQFDAPQRGIKNSFRLGDVGEMIIPLPPLPEQHRIVAKVDQLIALCDALEYQIDAATGKQTALLNGVMAQV